MHPENMDCPSNVDVLHDNYSKRLSVTVTVMGLSHQPLHQLEQPYTRRPPHYGSTNHSIDREMNECRWDRSALLYDEMASMTKLAIPVTFTHILEMLPGIVTVILVGRAKIDEESEESVSLQKLQIDAAALAVMFMNVVALSPGFGLLTAMDTLCSQAHGANQSTRMGTYALTGFVILSVLLVFTSIVLWNASSILIALGQPEAVSRLAGVFVRYLLPGIPFNFAYELIRKVSQSRNEAMPMLISSIVSNIATISLGYYLVQCTTWGWLGAAIARSVGVVVLVPVILMGMIMGLGSEEGSHLDTKIDCEALELIPKNISERTDETVDSHDDEDDKEFLHHLLDGFVIDEALSLRAVIEFLTLGFPGMLQLMFEWCAFEVNALLCGLLGGHKAIVGIGANAIIMNFSMMTYMLYMGVSVSGNVRIGNALGAGDSSRAETASILTLGSGALMSLLNITLLLTFRKRLPWLVTTDIDIVKEAQLLLIVAAVFQIPDSINASVQGIFRGSGRQALAAKLNFVAYYIIGLPLGYVLGIKFELGVVGLWCGMTVGLFTVCICGTILVLKSDWLALTDQAHARSKTSTYGA